MALGDQLPQIRRNGKRPNALGIVLEHIVPHTDSLLAVIMTSATNEIFQLKFEFCAQVEGEGSNRRINIMLDRKVNLSPTQDTVVHLITKVQPSSLPPPPPKKNHPTPFHPPAPPSVDSFLYSGAYFT